jgi:hypothetical protein
MSGKIANAMRQTPANSRTPEIEQPSGTMPNRLRFLFVILLSGVALGAGFIIFTSRGFSPPGPLIQAQHFRNYEVRIYKRDDANFLERVCHRLPGRLSGCVQRVMGRQEWSGVEILKSGRRVFSTYGGANYIGLAEFGSNSVAGIDITGDGKPNIALSEGLGRQGGGAFYLFECGEKFRQIATVESWGTYPELKDLDGDGVPELIASDNVFYHWPVCRDGEPMPEVILRWRNGKYVAASDLMYKPAPTREELEAMATAIRSSSGWNAESCWVPAKLWTNAIALMYSGHESLGWEFVERAWQPGFPGKDELLWKERLIDHYLRSLLNESLYWPDLKAQSSTPLR